MKNDNDTVTRTKMKIKLKCKDVKKPPGRPPKRVPVLKIVRVGREKGDEKKHSRKGRLKVAGKLKRAVLVVKKKNEVTKKIKRVKSKKRLLVTIPKPKRTNDKEKDKKVEVVSEDEKTDEEANSAMEKIYETTYAEDYIDVTSNMPRHVQSSVSSLVQDHLDVHDVTTRNITVSSLGKILEKVSSEMTTLLGDEADNGPLDLDNLSSNQKQALIALEQLLIVTSRAGDKRVQTSQKIADCLEYANRTLKVDRSNLHNLNKTDNASDEGNDDTPKKCLKRGRKPLMNPLPQRVYKNGVKRTPTKKSSVITKVTCSSTASPPVKVKPLKLDVCDEQSKSSYQSCASPVISIASSATEDPALLSLESIFSEDARYRSCKFKNPIQYNYYTRMNSTNPSKVGEKTGEGKVTRERKPKSKKESSSSSSSDDEPRYCVCNKVSMGRMVGCDNELCPLEWFHFKCVGLRASPKGKWYCLMCRDEHPDVMKKKELFLKELAEYNKKKEEAS